MGTDGSSHGSALAETLAVFEGAGEPGEPRTTTEVAAELECSRTTAAERLSALAERGDLRSKETGAERRVWWRPRDGTTDHHRNERRRRDRRDDPDDPDDSDDPDDQHRVTGVVRDAERALASATSRAAVERAVCDRLAAVDRYFAASVAERTTDGAFEIRTAAGVGRGSGDDPTGSGIEVPRAVAAAALDADAVQVVDDSERTASAAAVAMVPLVHADDEFGVITVRSNDPDGFDERATAVLGDLGATAARAMATTRQAERGRRLEALRDASRRFRDADSHEAVGEIVVETVTEDLGMADGHVYHFDTERNALEQVSTSVLFRSQAERSHALSSGDDSPVWSSFVAGETAVHGPGDGPVLPGQSLDRRLVVLVPIGNHGVLVAATDDADRLDADRRHRLELLAATAGSTLDALDSRAALRERDAALQERTRRLQRLDRVNTVVRDVDQALVRATSDEEIMRAVCEALAATDGFRFAWIGEANDAGDRLLPRAWSGDGQGYLDDAGVESVCPDGEPAGRALDAGAVTVVANVADDLHSATWRGEAFGREFQSVVSVPLAHGDVSYGVLSVYADRPDVFGELERSVFGELGRTVANAIDAVETRRALLNDQMVEIEFGLTGDSSSFLTRLAVETGSDVTFEGAVPVSDGAARIFFTVSGTAADDVRSTVDRFGTVDSARLVGSRGDGHLFEAVVSGSPVPLALLDHDATLLGLSASAAEARVVVGLPSSTDVRQFIERFLERYEGAEFVARRERETPVRSREGFRVELGESLTDRQLEVLKTAYLSDYFASPRASTGSELGEMLDISQPTVTEHLRAAQGKLLDLLFADDPTIT